MEEFRIQRVCLRAAFSVKRRGVPRLYRENTVRHVPLLYQK